MRGSSASVGENGDVIMIKGRIQIRRAFVPVAFLVVIVGCEQHPTVLSGNTEVDGVKVEYEWLPGEPPKLEARDSTTLELTSPHFQLKVVDRYLVLNGYKYGRIQSGDRVKVTVGGKLFVNGVKRGPVYAGT
jgi:hypothetical protein